MANGWFEEIMDKINIYSENIGFCLILLKIDNIEW